MSEERLHSDDPRLTAYALGELDAWERAALEKELQHWPAGRQAVEEIRRTADLLQTELKSEPVASLTEEQRVVVATAFDQREQSSVTPARRWPSRRFMKAALAFAASAACLGLVVVGLNFDALKPARVSSRNGRSSDEYLKLHGHGIDQEFNEQDQDIDGVFVVPQILNVPANEMTVGRPVVIAGRGMSPQSPRTGASGQSAKLANEGQSSFRVVMDRLDVHASELLAERLPTLASVNLRKDRKSLELESLVQSESEPHLGTMTGARFTSVGGQVEGALPLRPRIADGDHWSFRQEHSNTESYAPIVENEFLSPTGQPLSTFGIDVDTASYTNVRRFLDQGRLPPADAVRIEELVNYFRYDDPRPAGAVPFSVNLEVGPCPWKPAHRLVRIGLKAREIDRRERPPTSLVFLLDVSGSMRDENKLPLVKAAMEMLVDEMTENDRIAIVTYAGNAGLALDSTSGDRQTEIREAIRKLRAGGSTNGESGIRLAYKKAVERFLPEGANRVILCTDGDFNVGISADNQLVSLIADQARSGVFLSVFGFGMGNLKDSKLEKLADRGNGHYAYVDDYREARRVFQEEMTGTLYTIAKDVKLQIEFNPATVGAYRLIGYENRVMAAQDFDDDTKDAGDVGAGHSVTALYEIIPVDRLQPAKSQPLKYQESEQQAQQPKPVAGTSGELLTLALRFKQPDGDKSVRQEFPLADSSGRATRPSRDFDWAASVAAFGMILRNSQHRGTADFRLVHELATGALGPDESGRRREFIALVEQAWRLRNPSEAGKALD